MHPFPVDEQFFERGGIKRRLCKSRKRQSPFLFPFPLSYPKVSEQSLQRGLDTHRVRGQTDQTRPDTMVDKNTQNGKVEEGEGPRIRWRGQLDHERFDEAEGAEKESQDVVCFRSISCGLYPHN